jgi:AcrR family transcriptional regulator
MGIRERRNREKENLRREILDAASELFAREGYASVSMRKIAERIEYSPTTIYLYFKDKNDLLRQICEETFAKLIRKWEQIVRKNEDPLTALRKYMRAYVDFGLKYPNHYEVTFINPIADHLGGNESSYESSMGKKAFENLVTLVERCMQAGQLKKADVAQTSQVIWALGHGLVSLLISHKDFPFVNRKALIEGSIDMIFDGIKE